ncbi:MAG: DNA-binding protein [Muribaculaceae bacterium]|nr:DNA-binding protein [Muribaculaceae bacterium]
MKLRYFLPALLAVVATVLVGCKDDEATYLDEIRVSSSYVAIDEAGGETTIEITAADAWTLDNTAIPSWLTVSPTSGPAGTSKISFKAEAYVGGRDASFKIACAGKTQIINVIQGLKVAKDATCAEVIAGPDAVTYRVTGTCTGIYNTQYGNWYLADETGEITIYGTLDAKGQTKNFLSLGIEVGDIVTVEGPKKTYGTTVELVDVTVIKIVKSLIKVTEMNPAEAMPVEGGELAATLECKGNGVGVIIPEEAKSWLSISSVVNGITPTVSQVIFKVAPNEGGDRTADVTFTTYDSELKEYTAVATINQKGAIVKATVAEFLAAPEGNTMYRLQGVVSNIADAVKGNIYIRDFSGEVYGYKVSGFTGKVGDIITVVGKRASYSGSPQIGSGYQEELISVEQISITDFLAKPNDKTKYYMVTGTIDEIANATYGNLYINDGAGNRLYVYGCYPGWGATGDARKNWLTTANIELGDELTMIGYKDTYGEVIELCGGTYFSHTK